MASIRRSVGAKFKKRKGRDRDDGDEEKFRLPTEYEEPGGDLNDFAILIHGEKKIGKTSLAGEGGRVLFLQFDPPQISYRRMEIVCKNFGIFKKALKALEKKAVSGRESFPYDRVVVDRADLWHKCAQHFACEKLAIDHPADEQWGKGWDRVRTEFSDAVKRILNLPCGKWFLCHSDYEEVENRKGDKIRKLVPNLSGMPDEILNGMVDAWFAYTYVKRRRVLVVRGDERTGAGHRIDGHFLTPEGEPVETIPMGDSAKEAYKNLLAAFNNEQSSPNPGADTGSGKMKVRVRRKE